MRESRLQDVQGVWRGGSSNGVCAPFSTEFVRPSRALRSFIEYRKKRKILLSNPAYIGG